MNRFYKLEKAESMLKLDDNLPARAPSQTGSSSLLTDDFITVKYRSGIGANFAINIKTDKRRATIRRLNEKLKNL